MVALEPGFYEIDPLKLKHHPANPKIYGEDEDVSDLVELIAKYGIKRRLIVNTEGEIISGNRRRRSAIRLKFSTLPIEVVDLKSREEELELLLLENATRTKTVFQKVREGECWQDIERDRAAARKKATQNNNAAKADQENFPGLGSKGQSRDAIASRVGLGSGRNYQKATKVVEEIDKLTDLGKTSLASGLKKILNSGSIDSAHKLLKQSKSDREKIFELVGKDEALTVKEAQKLLEHGQIPDTNASLLGVGMRVLVKENAPIAAKEKGSITSFPNYNKAIVDFGAGRRELIDRVYLEPANEKLPQSLTNRTVSPLAQPNSNLVLPPSTEIKDNNGKSRSQTTKEYQSVEAELAERQKQLGLKSGGNSALPETDKLDDMQHQNPSEVGEDVSFVSDDLSSELNPYAIVNNLANYAEYLGKEHYRSIGKTIAQRKPEAIADVTEMMANNEENAAKMFEILANKYPSLIRKIEVF